jgi:hypothetical protein
MPRLFGYPIGADEAAVEEEGERNSWFGIAFVIFSSLLTLVIDPASFKDLYPYDATIILYGYCIYVQRRNNIGRLWVWKAVVASLPVHAAYIAIVVWIYKSWPGVTRRVEFLLFLFGFALEVNVFNLIATAFRPSAARKTTNGSSSALG